MLLHEEGMLVQVLSCPDFRVDVNCNSNAPNSSQAGLQFAPMDNLYGLFGPNAASQYNGLHCLQC